MDGGLDNAGKYANIYIPNIPPPWVSIWSIALMVFRQPVPLFNEGIFLDKNIPQVVY